MAISLTNIARDVQRKSNYFMIYKMVSISVSPIQECIFLNLAYLALLENRQSSVRSRICKMRCVSTHAACLLFRASYRAFGDASSRT